MGSLAPPDQQSASIRKRASATLADLHSSLEQRGGDFDEEDLLSSYASPLSHRTSTAKMNGRIVEDDYEDLISIPVAQALKPRRSNNEIRTFLPSSPSLTHSPTFPSSNDDPRRYSSEAPDPEKTAPWQTPDALAPMVYMDKETGEMKRVGKVEEMVLPAVARRLEAERIAKLMQGGGGDDGEEEGLVTGWGKDGMPRVIDPWNRRQSRDGGNTRPATAVVVEDNQQLPSPPPTPPTVELEKRKQQEEVRNEGVAALPAPVVIKGPTRSSSLRKRGRRQSTQPPPPPAGAAPPDHQYTFNFPPPPPSPVVGKKGKKQASEDAHGGGCCGCVVS